MAPRPNGDIGSPGEQVKSLPVATCLDIEKVNILPREMSRGFWRSNGRIFRKDLTTGCAKQFVGKMSAKSDGPLLVAV